MPLDAICLAAIKEELTGLVTGSKIDKIHQPEHDVLILTLRGGTGTCRLLLSAGPADNRVHLTQYKFDNPTSPPMFCMLLRKHLTGARIVGIEQPPAERMLVFELETVDAMGLISRKCLILELIGRMSNMILVDNDGIIVDCLRRIGGELTDKRLVLPGLCYRPPPAQQGKIDPLTVTVHAWQQVFKDAGHSETPEKTTETWLLSSFSALSPLICREITWRAYADAGIRLDAISDGGEALCREFHSLVGEVNSGKVEPCLLFNPDGAPSDFSYTRINQYEGEMSVEIADDFSSMLDGFFTLKAQRESIRQRASATLKTVKNGHDRVTRKLAIQHEELKKTMERERLRECGDLIMANLHQMKKGQRSLIALDLYSSNGEYREIVLDSLKTPQQNAAKYYKEYTKAKNAEKHLAEQICEGEKELAYLDSVTQEITLAESELDLADIRGELILAGYIKPGAQGNKKTTQSAPMRFLSSSGMQILAGRNNIQNDLLTMKTAMKSDVWLHTQKIHGSHVIICCGGKAPDDITLQEAAVIAAVYSGARSGGKVAVDITLAKNVKKPPGGRPGMVLYTQYSTIVVTPDEELVNDLRCR